jgi:hypothetical protein
MVSAMFRNIYGGGFSGVMYQDFSIKGEDSPTNPIRLLTQKTVGRRDAGSGLRTGGCR